MTWINEWEKLDSSGNHEWWKWKSWWGNRGQEMEFNNWTTKWRV